MPGFGDGGGDSMELPGAGYGAKKGWSMTTLALGLFALVALGALLLYGGGGGGSSLSSGEMAERRRSITESGRTLEAELEAVRQSVQHEQHSVEMLQAELSTLQADHHGHKTVVEAMPSSEGHGDAQAQLSACTAATDAVTTKLSEHTAAIAQAEADITSEQSKPTPAIVSELAECRIKEKTGTAELEIMKAHDQATKHADAHDDAAAAAHEDAAAAAAAAHPDNNGGDHPDHPAGARSALLTTDADQLFKQMDSDSDAIVTREELILYLQQKGVPMDDWTKVETLIDGLDHDNTGTIEEKELRSWGDMHHDLAPMFEHDAHAADAAATPEHVEQHAEQHTEPPRPPPPPPPPVPSVPPVPPPPPPHEGDEAAHHEEQHAATAPHLGDETYHDEHAAELHHEDVHAGAATHHEDVHAAAAGADHTQHNEHGSEIHHEPEVHHEDVHAAAGAEQTHHDEHAGEIHHESDVHHADVPTAAHHEDVPTAAAGAEHHDEHGSEIHHEPVVHYEDVHAEAAGAADAEAHAEKPGRGHIDEHLGAHADAHSQEQHHEAEAGHAQEAHHEPEAAEQHYEPTAGHAAVESHDDPSRVAAHESGHEHSTEEPSEGHVDEHVEEHHDEHAGSDHDAAETAHAGAAPEHHDEHQPEHHDAAADAHAHDTAAEHHDDGAH